MAKIKEIKARQILDSRGNPTIEVAVSLVDGTRTVASVPSGASTGKKEAVELRDGGKNFEGRGVLKAVSNVNNRISKALVGKEANRQEEIDKAMIDLDGTKNKGSLGANAILGVSLAVARSTAASQKLPLYKYINFLAGNSERINWPMPQLAMNILNGGEHAPNNVDIQEFMIAPDKKYSIADAIRIGTEVYAHLKSILGNHGSAGGVGDEGGFAPDLKSNTEAIESILSAVGKAGYKAREDISLCLDVAANSLYQDESYVLRAEGASLDADHFISLLSEWVGRYPIISIEDGLCESDWEGWKKLTDKLKDKIKIVGDDIFVTNSELLGRAYKEGVANATIIKPNQVGTLTETIKAINLAKEIGYAVFISHRSGETCDTFISDLAVGVSANFIKAGAPCRGERVAKYNRLLEIEEELRTK